MKKYKIYFSQKGKQMVEIVEANNEKEAYKIIENKYRFIGMIYKTLTERIENYVQMELNLDA